jgi:hypothetical protein
VFVPGDSKAGRLLDVLDDVFAAAVVQPVGWGQQLEGWSLRSLLRVWPNWHAPRNVTTLMPNVELTGVY